MDLVFVICGLIVGFVIGMSGVGGGSLMTPLLVMGFGVVLFEILNDFEEVLASSLFEQTHQIGRESFFGGCWDFRNFHSSFGEEATFLVLQDIGSING